MDSVEEKGMNVGVAVEDPSIRPTGVEADPVESRETVFTVLATRARSHSRSHLALTAIIGIVDAAALGWAHPALWPLAALFAAAGAYGAWGLLDSLLAERAAPSATSMSPSRMFALRVLRDMTAILGVIAALVAVGGIWDASLGGWRH